MKGSEGMNGLIIITSMVFAAYVAYKLTKAKILRYVLPPLISLLYGGLLFIIGMGLSGALYLLLALLPVIVGILYMFKRN